MAQKPKGLSFMSKKNKILSAINRIQPKGKGSNFMAWLSRLSVIDRWSTVRNINNENVAEHSHSVAAISHILVVIKNTYFSGSLDPDKAASIGLFHEVSESLLQDLNTKTKYFNPEIAAAFKNLERQAEASCVKTLPEKMRDFYSRYIESEKIPKEYKKIVKAADYLSAIIKSRDEITRFNGDYINIETRLMKGLLAMAKSENMPEVKFFIETFLDNAIVDLDELENEFRG